MNLGKYAKSVSALVTGVIGWGLLVVDSPSGPVSAREWMGLAVAGGVALGVYAYPNTPATPVVDPNQLAIDAPLPHPGA